MITYDCPKNTPRRIMIKDWAREYKAQVLKYLLYGTCSAPAAINPAVPIPHIILEPAMAFLWLFLKYNFAFSTFSSFILK